MRLYIYVTFFLFAFLAQAVTAQNNQGYITYERSTNMHLKFKDSPHVISRIPEYKYADFTLTFRADESVYNKKLHKTDIQGSPSYTKEQAFRRGIGRFNELPNNIYYKNTKEGKSLESTNLHGKQFLITGEIKKWDWKISNEQKEVGSFQCMKAEYRDTTTVIVAWFTPMIPVQNGPAEFGGLPGMMLHLDIDDGAIIYKATNIELKEIVEEDFILPSEGEQINREKFEIIKEEKMKEIEMERNGRKYIRRH